MPIGETLVKFRKIAAGIIVAGLLNRPRFDAASL
jgi:hypothetical protein